VAQISTKFVIYSPNWQSVSPIPRGVINGKCKSSTCLMHVSRSSPMCHSVCPTAAHSTRCVPSSRLKHTVRTSSASWHAQCVSHIAKSPTCLMHASRSSPTRHGMPAGLAENASLRLVSCFPQLPNAAWRARCWHYCSRWRTASNSKMAALTDTLSESSRPRIGMRMCASAASRHTCVRPVDSVPITMAVPRCMSVA